jgi:hypothetical protein
MRGTRPGPGGLSIWLTDQGYQRDKAVNLIRRHLQRAIHQTVNVGTVDRQNAWTEVSFLYRLSRNKRSLIERRVLVTTVCSEPGVSRLHTFSHHNEPLTYWQMLELKKEITPRRGIDCLSISTAFRKLSSTFTYTPVSRA